MFKLVVRQPFKNYVKGQEITDQDEIAGLGSRRDNHVIRVQMTTTEEAAVNEKRVIAGTDKPDTASPEPKDEASVDDPRAKRTR